jgi:hypothetical protein
LLLEVVDDGLLPDAGMSSDPFVDAAKLLEAGSAPIWGLKSSGFAKRDGEEGAGVLLVLGKHNGPDD